MKKRIRFIFIHIMILFWERIMVWVECKFTYWRIKLDKLAPKVRVGRDVWFEEPTEHDLNIEKLAESTT